MNDEVKDSLIIHLCNLANMHNQLIEKLKRENEKNDQLLKNNDNIIAEIQRSRKILQSTVEHQTETNKSLEAQRDELKAANDANARSIRSLKDMVAILEERNENQRKLIEELRADEPIQTEERRRGDPNRCLGSGNE